MKQQVRYEWVNDDESIFFVTSVLVTASSCSNSARLACPTRRTASDFRVPGDACGELHSKIGRMMVILHSKRRQKKQYFHTYGARRRTSALDGGRLTGARRRRMATLAGCASTLNVIE